jgi:exopolysaccharide biosynthesis polyprenyl glycosylphosphotransferase
VQAIVLAVLLWTYKTCGLYRSRLSLSLLDDLPYLALGVLAGLVTEVAATAYLPGTTPGRDQLLRTGALLAAILVVRGVAYVTVRHARSTGRVRHTALVIGAGHVGIRLVDTLQEHREYGLDVVGVVDSMPRLQPGGALPVPVFSSDGDDLAKIIEDYAVKVVIVAFSSVREAELVGILRTCDRLRCEIFFVPRLYELHYVTRDMDQAWGIPLVRVRRAPFRQLSWRLKRVMDVVLSAVALLLLAPVLIACAIGVRIEGGAGVLFRQQRVGLDGREFTVLKFRSLRPATQDESAPSGTSLRIRVSALSVASSASPRSTSCPQLWNVLRGDMSLVGPRPERPHFVNQFRERIPRYMARHRVPAGLTGHAQVHGLRGNTSIEHRASFDNYYIENWSLGRHQDHAADGAAGGPGPRGLNGPAAGGRPDACARAATAQWHPGPMPVDDHAVPRTMLVVNQAGGGSVMLGTRAGERRARDGARAGGRRHGRASR